MLAAAAHARQGDRSAVRQVRERLAELREGAADVLEKGGHAASDVTLRRIGASLAAIAAEGGFDPDPPGALAADRDAPGFDAVRLAPDSIERRREGEVAKRERHGAPPSATRTTRKASSSASKERADRKRADRKQADDRAGRKLAEEEREHRRDELAALRARAAADRARARTLEAERRAEKRAENRRRIDRARESSRLRAALRKAKADLDGRQRTVASLEKRLRAGEDALSGARERVAEIERNLADSNDDTR